MKWRYKTILFEFQKDGMLGDKYIDEEQVEAELNEHGVRGWELVTVTMAPDGLLAFCKNALPGQAQAVQSGVSQPATAVNIPKPVPTASTPPVKPTTIGQQKPISPQSGNSVGDIKIL